MLSLQHPEPSPLGLSGLLKPKVSDVPSSSNPTNSSILFLSQIFQNASSSLCSYKHEPCMSAKQHHIFLLCIPSLLLSFPHQTQQFRNPSICKSHHCAVLHMDPMLIICLTMTVLYATFLFSLGKELP